MWDALQIVSSVSKTVVSNRATQQFWNSDVCVGLINLLMIWGFHLPLIKTRLFRRSYDQSVI